jgi:hypothetical protein
VVLLVTIGIGAYGLRFARTTSDFLVASRTVSPSWNAAAISGEYLSAASFLGVAGLILRNGVDVLWYPVGFAAGYLALLLFVAAPLRRSGAFTLPDFCELRLRSLRLRRLATVFVIFIGCLYLVPQLQGAGLTFTTVTAAPTNGERCSSASSSPRTSRSAGMRRDHVRAGVPVLAQADRARRTGDLPGAAVAVGRAAAGDTAGRDLVPGRDHRRGPAGCDPQGRQPRDYGTKGTGADLRRWRSRPRG